MDQRSRDTETSAGERELPFQLLTVQIAEQPKCSEYEMFAVSPLVVALLLQQPEKAQSGEGFLQPKGNHRNIRYEDVKYQKESIEKSPKDLEKLMIVSPFKVSDTAPEGDQAASSRLLPVCEKDQEEGPSSLFAYTLDLETATQLFQLVHPDGQEATLPDSNDPTQVVAAAMQVMRKMSLEELHGTLVQNVQEQEQPETPDKDDDKCLFRLCRRILQKHCHVRITIVDGLLRCYTLLRILNSSESLPQMPPIGTSIQIIVPICEKMTPLPVSAPLDEQYNLCCRRASLMTQINISKARSVKCLDAFLAAVQYRVLFSRQNSTPPWIGGTTTTYKEFISKERFNIFGHLGRHICPKKEMNNFGDTKEWKMLVRPSESGRDRSHESTLQQSLFARMAHLATHFVDDSRTASHLESVLLGADEFVALRELRLDYGGTRERNKDAISKACNLISQFFVEPQIELWEALKENENVRSDCHVQDRYQIWLEYCVQLAIGKDILKAYHKHLTEATVQGGLEIYPTQFQRVASLLKGGLLCVSIQAVGDDSVRKKDTSKKKQLIFLNTASLDKFDARFKFTGGDFEEEFSLHDILNTEVRSAIDAAVQSLSLRTADTSTVAHSDSTGRPIPPPEGGSLSAADYSPNTKAAAESMVILGKKRTRDSSEGSEASKRPRPSDGDRSPVAGTTTATSPTSDSEACMMLRGTERDESVQNKAKEDNVETHSPGKSNNDNVGGDDDSNEGSERNVAEENPDEANQDDAETRSSRKNNNDDVDMDAEENSDNTNRDDMESSSSGMSNNNDVDGGAESDEETEASAVVENDWTKRSRSGSSKDEDERSGSSKDGDERSGSSKDENERSGVSRRQAGTEGVLQATDEEEAEDEANAEDKDDADDEEQEEEEDERSGVSRRQAGTKSVLQVTEEAAEDEANAEDRDDDDEEEQEEEEEEDDDEDEEEYEVADEYDDDDEEENSEGFNQSNALIRDGFPGSNVNHAANDDGGVRSEEDVPPKTRRQNRPRHRKIASEPLHPQPANLQQADIRRSPSSARFWKQPMPFEHAPLDAVELAPLQPFDLDEGLSNTLGDSLTSVLTQMSLSDCQQLQEKLPCLERKDRLRSSREQKEILGFVRKTIDEASP